MSFKFEKLEVWNLSMDFGEDINLLIKKWPEQERFNLCSQILRASDSVALNISEGSILQSGSEFRRFLGYSIRSVSEVVTCLYKANRRDYIDQSEFDTLYLKSYELMNKLIAFRNSIK